MLTRDVGEMKRILFCLIVWGDSLLYEMSAISLMFVTSDITLFFNNHDSELGPVNMNIKTIYWRGSFQEILKLSWDILETEIDSFTSKGVKNYLVSGLKTVIFITWEGGVKQCWLSLVMVNLIMLETAAVKKMYELVKIWMLVHDSRSCLQIMMLLEPPSEVPWPRTAQLK